LNCAGVNRWIGSSGATLGGTKLAQTKEALEKLLNKFPEVETLARNLGFHTGLFYRTRNLFSRKVPHREQMQALVAASEKVRALLKPIAKYNLRLEQLVKDGLSPTDGRKALEAREPDLVLARDNQVVIQRRSQLLAQRRQYTREKEKSKTLTRRL
jgi:hypothetical protein